MLEQGVVGPDSKERSSAVIGAASRASLGLKSALGRWPRIMNIGLLIAGLGLGQGTIFAVQTWLVTKGSFELLSMFATHYSLAIFGIILVDGGSSAIITRHLARLSGGHEDTEDFWRTVGSTMAFRLLVAVLVSTCAATYVACVPNDGFSRFYVLFGVPGLLLWAGNGVGLLDGLKLSGLSGITGSAAYAASAVGLALAPDASPEIAGSILGGAFTIGYLVTVAAQWAVLRSYGWAPRFRRVTLAGFRRSCRDGIAMVIQAVPGQIILRVQLVLSMTYLGAETTALFAYVKQLIAMASMIIAIILRVEFPGFVQILSRSKERSLRLVLTGQRMALYCAFALTIGGAIVSALGLMIPQHRISAAAMTLLTFSPSILTISLTLMMVQALVALGAYGAVARGTAIGAALGAVFSALFVRILDIYALLFGEMVFHLACLLLMYKDMRRSNSASLSQ
jgi:O-antigen/teichoic acid export membrane protein